MKRIVPLLLVACVCITFASAGSVQPRIRPTKTKPVPNQTGYYGEPEHTETEELILQQLNCGCPADLSTFPDERDRVVKASFLREILTQPSEDYNTLTNKGLYLVNAIIEGDLYVQEAEIATTVVFDKCQMDAVDFLGTKLRKGLTLRQCKIKSFEGPEEINGNFELNGSTVSGPLHIDESRISGNIYAAELTVVGSESDVALSGSISKRCDFTNSRFEGPVACSNLRVGGSLWFGGSKFQSPEQTQFDSMTIHEDFDLSAAHFTGPVTFMMSHVGGNFGAVETVFAFQSMGKYLPNYLMAQPPLESARAPEMISFEGVLAIDLQIGGYAVMTGAVFNGAADFTGMNVGRYLDASGAHFNYVANAASFSRCKIGGAVNFASSAFAGGIDITDTDVGKSLSLDEATASGPVTLTDSRIVGMVSCDRAQFTTAATLDASSATAIGGIRITASVLRGAVNLQYFETKGDVSFDDTWFMSNAETNLFESKFGRNVSACGTHFAGYVNAFHITVGGSLDLTGAWIESENGFSGETAEVKTKLILSEITAAGNIDFAAGTAGSVFFRRVTFLNSRSVATFSDFTVVHLGVFEHVSGQLSLQDSRFGELSFENISQLPRSNPLNLMGTKSGLWVVNGSDRTSEFLKLLTKCEFHVSTYAAFEQYLRAAGRPSEADEIFVTGRRAAVRQSGWPLRAWSWLLDYGTGYGRHMERLVWWLMGFVGIGTVVFRDRDRMRPRDHRQPQAYNPFWYSLGLFLPFDNLGISREWVPLDNRRFARHYVHVQQLAGWLLVSLGIGALLGLR